MSLSPTLTATVDSLNDRGGIGGHPRGLSTLFFSEMWERFSYYGMRALLMLFMTLAVAEGGLGLSTERAANIYGTYTMSVYLLGILGGFIADNFIGSRRAVLIGGIIIACGHYAMAIPTTSTFFIGLFLVAVGTGLLKPNISTMVGSLYAPEDARRDAGFSIFYMGINIGALVTGLVCPYLAQAESFRAFLGSIGVDRQSHPIRSGEQVDRRPPGEVPRMLFADRVNEQQRRADRPVCQPIGDGQPDSRDALSGKFGGRLGDRHGDGLEGDTGQGKRVHRRGHCRRIQPRRPDLLEGPVGAAAL